MSTHHIEQGDIEALATILESEKNNHCRTRGLCFGLFMFSLVMLFNQPRTAGADVQMETMTQVLIDAALKVGGRYYLPYRLHATREQFYRAYLQAERFFALKRKHDPDEVFQNQFYLKYK